MENILITSGLTSFAQRVAKLFPEENVFFADANSIPDFFLQKGKYATIPSSDTASFLHEVLKTCLDLSIDKLVPLGESELIALAKSRALFEEYGIILLIPSLERLENISKLIDPTPINSAEIKLGGPNPEDYGVFTIDNEGHFALCCIK